MPISINITGENAAEVTAQIKDLASIMSGGVTKEVAATVEDKPKKPVTKKAAAAPIVEEVEAVGEENEVTDEDMEEEEIPDDVELRAAAKEAGGKTGGRDKVKALLKKYDVANVTSVPDADRVKFLKDLQAI